MGDSVGSHPSAVVTVVVGGSTQRSQGRGGTGVGVDVAVNPRFTTRYGHLSKRCADRCTGVNRDGSTDRIRQTLSWE